MTRMVRVSDRMHAWLKYRGRLEVRPMSDILNEFVPPDFEEEPEFDEDEDQDENECDDDED